MQRKDKRGLSSRGGERGVPARADNFDYSLGNIVSFGGLVHRCVFPLTGAGTSAGTEPTIIAPIGASDEITNGDFTTDTSSWIPTNSTTSAAGEFLTITNSAATFGRVSQTNTLTNGMTYMVSLLQEDGTAGGGLVIIGSGTLLSLGLSNVSFTESAHLFTANQASIELRLTVNSTVSGHTTKFDTVRERAVTLDGTCAWETIGYA